jgi:hypothetical protein
LEASVIAASTSQKRFVVEAAHEDVRPASPLQTIWDSTHPLVISTTPVLQQHFSLIFGRGVGDHRVAGVVAQFTAALVVGQFRAGLVAAPPA